jgi:formamidopyrimidine-DNA glycosylase
MELRFRDPRRFGGVWYFPNGRVNRDLKPLGPDALGIRVPILREITQRSRQIKAVLMDQQVISGLGNIYCDEALFAARIHPLTPASRITEDRVKALACSIRKVLKSSIESGGSTLNDYRQPDGREGTFQRIHKVYDRKGLPCERCGSKIVRIVAAGRSTHFCPKCQK